jgi:hypothetical protein
MGRAYDLADDLAEWATRPGRLAAAAPLLEPWRPASWA